MKILKFSLFVILGEIKYGNSISYITFASKGYGKEKTGLLMSFNLHIIIFHATVFLHYMILMKRNLQIMQN